MKPTFLKTRSFIDQNEIDNFMNTGYNEELLTHIEKYSMGSDGKTKSFKNSENSVDKPSIQINYVTHISNSDKCLSENSHNHPDASKLTVEDNIMFNQLTNNQLTEKLIDDEEVIRENRKDMFSPRKLTITEESNSSKSSKEKNTDGSQKVMVDGYDDDSEQKNEEMDYENFKWFSDMQYWVFYLAQTIGYGSFWRFPSVIHNNGGSAFLIPYFLFVFCLIVPQAYFETSLGQYFRLPQTDLYKNVSNKWKGVGYAIVLNNVFYCIYYFIVMCWCFLYLIPIFSFDTNFPWHGIDDNGKLNKDLLNKTSDYFYTEILFISDGDYMMSRVYTPILMAYLINWMLIYFCLKNGMKFTSRITFFTVFVPIIVVLIFFIIIMMLPGAFYGLSQFMSPDWEKLKHTKIWINAAQQVQLQFSVGLGTGLVQSRFREHKKKIKYQAFYIQLFNATFGLVSSFIVFGFLGYFMKFHNITMDQLPIKGVDQFFVTYPAIFAVLAYGKVAMILFIVVIIQIGISTQFQSVEVLTIFIEDQNQNFFGIKLIGNRARKFVCASLLVIGLPFTTRGGYYIWQNFDRFILQIPGSFINLVTQWIFSQLNKCETLFEQLSLINHEKLSDLNIWFQNNISIWIYFFLILFGIYRIETIISPKQNWSEYISGHIVGYIGIATILTYYVRYINAEVNKNPYDKDFFELEGGSIYKSVKEQFVEKSPRKAQQPPRNKNINSSSLKQRVSDSDPKVIQSEDKKTLQGKRMIMKATTPSQLKRILKLYHDQQDREGNNKASMIPSEFRHLVEKDSEICRVTHNMEPFRKAITENVAFQNHTDVTIYEEELKSTYQEPKKKYGGALKKFSRYRSVISNNLREFWGYDKEERKNKNKQALQDIGTELKELDKESNYSIKANRSCLSHSKTFLTPLEMANINSESCMAIFNEDNRQNTPDETYLPESATDSTKNIASVDNNLQSPEKKKRPESKSQTPEEKYNFIKTDKKTLTIPSNRNSQFLVEEEDSSEEQDKEDHISPNIDDFKDKKLQNQDSNMFKKRKISEQLPVQATIQPILHTSTRINSDLNLGNELVLRNESSDKKIVQTKKIE